MQSGSLNDAETVCPEGEVDATATTQSVRKELDVVPLLFEYWRRHRPGDKTFPAVIGAPQEQDIVLVRQPCRVSVIRVDALLLVMGTNDQPRQAGRVRSNRTSASTE